MMLRRLMMATSGRNFPGKLRGETKPKLKDKDVVASSSRDGVSSAPNAHSTGGKTGLRNHSTQVTQPPPRPPKNHGATTRGSGPRKTPASSSAGNVNKNRNILRTGSASSERSFNNSFKKLTIDDKKAPRSATPKRRQSSSAGNSSTFKTIEDVARRILQKKSKNIVVMAGAGISTPSGIPDFRSPGSGLYDNLQQYRIPYPEAIFDIDFFRKNPKPFFTLAKELYPSGKYRPNYVHYFVRMLYEKGLLLRMYTQNIDGLERLAGIPGDKLVEAHGTFTRCTCTKCGYQHEGEDVKGTILGDRIPRCSRPRCTGVVKPNIVFFGEDLPKRFFYYMKDMPLCDLLIVMGTSLEVYPFAGIVDSVRPFVPRLLINREVVGPFSRPSSSRHNDLAVTGDLVECVQKFARVLGWKKALEDVIKDNEVKLDAMVVEMESKAAKSSTEPSENTNNNATDQNAKTNTSPQRLTGLQREQDTTHVRKIHTESLSKANSQRAPSDASRRRINSSGTARSSLPRITNFRRTRPHRTVADLSSSSSESSTSESSSEDDY
ncbi:NAD-dependent protein deacetylase sirtuin-3 [Strongylocentrotus purpuratus]|uniref:Deacetylase sirtuin-type domain-containing protein n=1 Tax=Strongylocentrotus purpuratus TaxID=7668 RepID=A0A7M7P4N3_STRPU|nr:NAD-dependent protein deacetylase sirtuin-3 [Strongylocentrotus purpuratus]